MTTQIILPTVSTPEIFSWVLMVAGIIWIIYSIVATYHWLSYSYNPVTGVVSLAVYYLMSLALLGSMITFL